jgi:hypothetical protein
LPSTECEENFLKYVAIASIKIAAPEDYTAQFAAWVHTSVVGQLLIFFKVCQVGY